MNVGEGAGLSGMKLGRPPLGDWLEVAPVSGPEGDEVAGEQADRQRARPSQGSARRRRTRFVIGRLGRVDRVVVTRRSGGRQARGTLGGSTGVGSWSDNSAASARPSA